MKRQEVYVLRLVQFVIMMRHNEVKTRCNVEFFVFNEFEG